MAVVMLLLLGLVYVQTAGFLQRRVDGVLISDASALTSHGPQQIYAAMAQEAARDSLMGGGVFSPNGDLLGGDEIVKPSELMLDSTAREFVSQAGRAPQRALAQRLPWGDVLVVHRDVSQLIELRLIVVRALLWSGAAITVIGMALAVALSVRPLRRVRAVSEASRAVASGDLTVRLPVDGSGDELDELARIVNDMMDDVERLVIQAQTVGESVAHELRTPLTRLRAILDRAVHDPATSEAGRGLLETCVAETETMLARFQALLRIAAVDAMNRKSGIASVSLSEIVAEICELYQPLAADRGLELHTMTESGIEVRGDAELLSEALSNLIDNALKFSLSNGHVWVRLERSPGGPILSVRDNGVGIPEADRTLVSKRFYRAQHSAHLPGHGLGLSLVASVAEAHGFQIAIEDASPGTLVRLHCGLLQRPFGDRPTIGRTPRRR
ncbi:MAG: sensor histidine kinase [Caulobacteraceae bacterium]